MPTYVYECEKCGSRFEVFHSISAEPLKKHSDIHKYKVEGARMVLSDCDGKVKRIISGGSGVIFKGKGFYSTDYKKKKGKPEPKQYECEVRKPDGWDD